MAEKITYSIPLEEANAQKLNIDSQMDEGFRKAYDQITHLKLLQRMHETQHRNEASADLKEAQERMYMERIAIFNKLDKLDEKWSEIQETEEVISVHDNIQLFKNNVADLLTEKDKIDEFILNDIERMHKSYQKYLLFQDTDLVTMAERITRHIDNVHETFQEKTKLFESIIEKIQSKWEKCLEMTTNDLVKRGDDHYKQNRMQEKVLTSQRDDWMKIADAQEQMTKMNIVQLERDRDHLQMDLQLLRVDVTVAIEQLINKYTILKLREEENKNILTIQKRAVAAVKYSIADYQHKILEQMDKHSIKIQKLSNKVVSIHRLTRDLEIRESIRKHNFDQKFLNIWKLNESEVIELFERLQKIDKTIHEHILGIKWTQTPMPPRVFTTAHKYWKNYNAIKLTSDFVPGMLHQLSITCDFLLDDKILQILEKHSSQEHSLVKLQTIFTVINIKDEDDMKRLTDMFQKYSYCRNCVDKLIYDPDKILRRKFYNRERDRNKIPTPTSVSCGNHELFVEPAFVIIVLRDFCELHQNTREKMCKPKPRNDNLNLKDFNDNEVSNFWNEYRKYNVPHITDYLNDGLENYLRALQKRDRLESRNKELRKQNYELQLALKDLWNKTPEK